ncbi:hypothetical protein ACFE04_023597 [Oxalis oulophora]
MEEIREWIKPNETAKEMMNRIMSGDRRPLLLLPPLHRIPLRPGNVLELVGPSPSAKTTILIQESITCILPQEWNGLHFGGLGRLVMYIDLDCRFDVLRLSQMLRQRIRTTVQHHQLDDQVDYDKLFVPCMKRFVYLRCYNTLQFLATLKTLHYRIKKESETHGVSVCFLMIDSIGSFHWMERAAALSSRGGSTRKCLSLQSVSETVVQELKRLLLVHPLLVIATKANILGDRYVKSEGKWNFKKWSSLDASSLNEMPNNNQRVPYRDYMPSIWQSFVTHRIVLRATDSHLTANMQRYPSVYISEWLLPPLSFADKFEVRDGGVIIVP